LEILACGDCFNDAAVVCHRDADTWPPFALAATPAGISVAAMKDPVGPA
jgi:hypothetical protein